MQYSELPHVDYIVDGKGPGSVFLGDAERWNWRYTFKGLELDHNYDAGVAAYFNDAQRGIMQQPPLDALEVLRVVLTAEVTPEVATRLDEAHDRMFKPAPTMAEVYSFETRRRIG